ncbi:MAG: hypothetical protein KDC12_10365 [Flavobacteriales bacterium]|nr:hypothetical protein [Flavobacteriales bacterium]
MFEVLHQAAQYIVAAALSFRSDIENHAQVKLHWIPNHRMLVGPALDEAGEVFPALNLDAYALEFVDADYDVLHTMYLESVRHDAVLFWIASLADELELDGFFQFDLPYDLPYGTLNPDDLFPEPDYNELDRLGDVFSKALNGMSRVLTGIDNATEIAWDAQHFTMGAVIVTGVVDETITSSIGVGLAPPEESLADWYVYVSIWLHSGNYPQQLPAMTHGTWQLPHWNGAVAAASPLSEKDMAVFFEEGVAILARFAI